ncbi:MAG: hypothetical protein JWN52_6620 [Actinomycetia bacterium]|nr:hypothetical protein [Actinomycetes bacterium]
MNATLSASVEWGVRHHGHLAAAITVDVRADEADARHWCASLLWCGNSDAVLVARAAGADAAWIPQGGA